nr:DoxX family protein [Corynebacterium sp. TAE3-ERU12]
MFADNATASGAAVAADEDYNRDEEDDDEVETRRGTLDLGLLVLRLVVGGMLLLHGLSTFFGFSGAAGVGQLENDYAQAGWNMPGLVAVLEPTLQVIAGALLVLGLATPLGAALAIVVSAFSTMADVALNSSGWDIISAEGSGYMQLFLLLTGASLALQFTGPGRYGLDVARGWARRPLVSSWLFALIAIAAAVAIWFFVTGSLPFVGSSTVDVPVDSPLN